MRCNWKVTNCAQDKKSELMICLGQGYTTEVIVVVYVSSGCVALTVAVDCCHPSHYDKITLLSSFLLLKDSKGP